MQMASSSYQPPPTQGGAPTLAFAQIANAIAGDAVKMATSISLLRLEGHAQQHPPPPSWRQALKVEENAEMRSCPAACPPALSYPSGSLPQAA